MRLTDILFRRNRLPNGHLFRGKDRLVKRVQPVDVRRLRQDYELEERNMYFLRYPYLSEEQSFGHAKALGKHEAFLARVKVHHQKKFKPDVTLADRLMHLRVRETWD